MPANNMTVTEASVTVDHGQHIEDRPNAAVEEVLKAREALVLTSSTAPSFWLRNKHT